MGPTTGTSSPVSKRSSPRNRSSPVLGNNSLSFKIIDHSLESSSTKNHPFIQNNSIPKKVTSPIKPEAVRNSPRNIVASIPSLEPKAYYSKSSLVDVNNPPQLNFSRKNNSKPDIPSLEPKVYYPKSSLVDVNNPPQLKSSKKTNNKPGLKPSSSSSRHGEKSRTKKSSCTKLLVAKLGQPLHRSPKTISVTNTGGSESLLQDLDNFFNDIDEGTKDMFDDVSSLSSISDNGEMDISPKDRSRRSSTPLSSVFSSDGDTPLVTKMPTSHNKRRKESSSEDPVLLKIKKIKPNPPAPLLNPIKIMNKGLGEASSSSNNQPNGEESFRQEWRDQVSNDISIIRSGNGGLRFKFSTQNGSTKKKEDPFSLVKKSTRTSFSPKLGNDKIEDDKTAYNDDHCSTCLQIGQLMCCDSCTRAFHPSCLEEGYDFDRIPEGAWDCKVCRSKKSPMRKKPIINSASPQEKINSAFESLNHKIDKMNPKVFELPAPIRNSFENVWTHPSTGDYINTDEYDVNVLPCRPGRTPRSHNKRKSSKTSMLSALARSTNNASSHSDLPVFDNNNNVSSSTTNTNTSDRKKIIPICFKCSKSDIKLRHENVLNSFKYGSTSRSTFPEKNTLDIGRMKLQSNTSPMIKCDYCDLHWHLDCLDPPLTVLPSSKTDETEIVDINSIRLMKLKTWGVGSDMKDVEGLIELKKKWMCPCHADWKLPSERIEIEKEPTNKNQHRSLPTSPTKTSAAKRTRPNASASASPASSPPPRKSSIRKTARALIILNDSEIKKLRPSAPSSSKIVIPIESKRVLNGNKHLVPEASVKLDFLSKVKSMKDLRHNNVSSSSRAEKLIVLPESVESKLSTTFPKGLGEVYDFSSIQKLYSMTKRKGIAADVDNNVGPSSLQAAEEVVHFTCNVDDHPAVNGLQCTRDEAAEWLSSITQLQQDVAVHLKRYLKDEI